MRSTAHKSLFISRSLKWKHQSTYFWSMELHLESAREGQVDDGVRVALLKLDTEGSRPIGEISDSWNQHSTSAIAHCTAADCKRQTLHASYCAKTHCYKGCAVEVIDPLPKVNDLFPVVLQSKPKSLIKQHISTKLYIYCMQNCNAYLM